jgi:histidinol-phosphate aminotransferase
MSIRRESSLVRSAFSRRSFLQVSSLAASAAGLRVVTEPMLAYAANRTRSMAQNKDSVMINSNENPLGPCAKARQAVVDLAPQGGRYLDHLTEELQTTFCQQQGLKPDQLLIYAGSTEPLHYSVLSFTSPTRSYVTADPGFEAGLFMSTRTQARVVKVPLTKSYAHDVKAMLAAGQDAGLFYVCNPNNPTGTLTSLSDIAYLVENKPKGSVVLVDEAYLHFSDAESAIDLVKANKDVIVLRTFSKIYGLAGLRCGVAIAKPELLEKLDYFGGNFMPITGAAAATASLKDDQLIPERKRVNAEIRQATFDWLDRNGYSYIPSQANFFMLDVKKPAKGVIDAMAKQNVFIGRVWPAMPTYSRITVGTRPEMEKFQIALKAVMDGTAVGVLNSAPPVKANRLRNRNLFS